jgi:hypothetical protein
MREVTIITFGAGRVGYGVGSYDGTPALGLNILKEGLKLGDIVPKDHPRELALVLKFLNLEGLAHLESALSKIRIELEKNLLSKGDSGGRVIL